MARLNADLLLKLAAILVVVLIVVYIIDPTLIGFRSRYEGFEEEMKKDMTNGKITESGSSSEGFADAGVYTPMGSGAQDQMLNYGSPSAEPSPAQFGDAVPPSGCYPRDQITPLELLPRDTNSTWAQQNPMGNGSLKGKNFLSAGALIGVNTVGQSLRNANLQLRSEPQNPQMPVSVWQQSTIEPDMNRRPLEIG
jgi:hypothetical protein